MNGLVAAAAEAEAILKKAKWNTPPLDLNDDLDSNDGSLDHSVRAWGNDRQYFSNIGRKRPAEQYSSNSFSPGKREQPSQSASPVKKKAKFNIHDKLRELYEEFSADESLQTNYQGLKVNSYLLEKLLTRINLNVLIINLYPGNKGYSISLKLNGDTHMLSPPHDGATNNCRSDESLLETARWPYEEEDLLSYIDNEELPIVLLDLLESEYSSLFYSGCIIAQIRDYRQAYPSFVCDTHHVLLKPTTQSIISDVNAIARAGSWGREERLYLESAVVLATAPPLCLEPRPAVGLLAAKLHHQRHLLATPDIRRQARRFSQVAINRKRRLDQFTQYRGLSLLDLINKQRGKLASIRNASSNTSIPRASSKYPKKPSEVLRAVVAPRIESPPLTPPTDVDSTVARLAKAYERPRNLPDCAPQLIEEYVLETERAPTQTSAVTPNAVPGVFHIKLSIFQRPSNQEYLGELYVDRDHVEGERNGSACRFPLGTRAHANRYIQQFTEIFTEEGRKSVRIKHLVPGQLPKLSYTGMREMAQAQLAMQVRAQSLAVAAAVAAAAPTPLSGNGATTTVQANAGVGVVPQQGLVGNFKLPPPSPAVPSPTGIVAAPAPSPEVVLIAGPPPARRTISASLPLLQAQLQAGPQAVQQLQASQVPTGSPVQPVASQLEQTVAELKQQTQTLNTIQHLQLHQSGLKHQSNEQLQTVHIATPQVSQIQHIQQMQNAQQTANQLLVQQLTNPPQPLNPHKLQSAIIHIQHPLSSQLLQQKVGTSQPQIQTQGQHVTLQAQPGITLQGQPSLTLQGQQGITVQGQQGITLQSQGVALQSQGSLNIVSQQNNVSAPVRPIQKVAPLKQRSTNPAISALVTSLMNSAQQYQQQQQLAANSANNSNALGTNSQMLSLLSNDANTLNKTTTVPVVTNKKPIPQTISNSGGSYGILGSNAQMISLLNSDSTTMIKTPTGISTIAGVQNKKNTLPTSNSVASFNVIGTNTQMLSLLNSDSANMIKTSPITGTIAKKTNPSIVSSSIVNSGVHGTNSQVLSLLNSESSMAKNAAGVTIKKGTPLSVTSSAGTSGVSGANIQMLNLLNNDSANMTKTPVGTANIGDNAKKTNTQSSALLERLMAPPAPVTQNQNAPQSIDILSQFQNVQLQIPGCPQPLSFSLNVSADGSTRYLVSVSQRAPSTSTKILTVPINNTIEEKNMHPVQLVTCPRVAPGQLPMDSPVPADSIHYMGNTIQTIANQERRRSNPSEPNK